MLRNSCSFGTVRNSNSTEITDEIFLMTYGDGVGCIDIKLVVAFCQRHLYLATIAAVRLPARFGRLEFDGD